jgi:hypothetical protein
MGFTRRASVLFTRMSRPRRRSTASIALGVVFALVAATFASRGQRRAEPTPADQRAFPAAAASPAVGAPETRATPQRDTRTAPTAGPGFTSRRSLVEHFDKHGDEFPGLSMTAYLAAAQALRDAPEGGDVLELRRRDGVITRFDRASGAFIAVNGDGTIRTFFRPNDGEAYFRRQASRTPGGGP